MGTGLVVRFPAHLIEQELGLPESVALAQPSDRAQKALGTW